MTLLMRPFEDDVDAEWKDVLADYSKTRSERELLRGVLDNHIALVGLYY